MLIPQLPSLRNIFDFGHINFGPSTLLDTPISSSIDLNTVFLTLAVLGSLTIAELVFTSTFDKYKNKQKI